MLFGGLIGISGMLDIVVIKGVPAEHVVFKTLGLLLLLLLRGCVPLAVVCWSKSLGSDLKTYRANPNMVLDNYRDYNRNYPCKLRPRRAQ